VHLSETNFLALHTCQSFDGKGNDHLFDLLYLQLLLLLPLLLLLLLLT
jgi:hypothetical protein